MIGFCPTNFLESAKTRALQVAAAAVGKTAAPVSILVNFQPLADDKNHVGGPNLLRHVTTSLLEQAVSTPPPCVGCGDCVSGCNYSAKSTIIMNYLPDAKNHSAEIFTRARARHVEKTTSGWNVHGQIVDKNGCPKHLCKSEVAHRTTARVCARDLDINGVGFGGRKVGDMPPVGPCSTVMVDWRNDDDVSSGTVMEDGAIPGAISALLGPTLAIGSRLLGVGASHGWCRTVRYQI